MDNLCKATDHSSLPVGLIRTEEIRLFFLGLWTILFLLALWEPWTQKASVDNLDAPFVSPAGAGIIIVHCASGVDEKCNGKVQWESAMKKCIGKVQWKSTVEKCSGKCNGKVQWESAKEKCNGKVQWKSAVEKCSGEAQWKRAVEKCNGKVQ